MKREQITASRMLQANAGLAEDDPWDLPQIFFMGKESSSTSLRTRSGYWKGKEDTAIRSQGAGSSAPSRSPSYSGLRRTLEFYGKDGTKTDWVMHEYRVLDPDRHKPDALFLQEDVVVRTVFKKEGTDHRVPSHLREVSAHVAEFVQLSLRVVEGLLMLAKDAVLESSMTELENTVNSVLLDLWMALCKEDLGGCEAGSGCGESAAPDGESEVWQHFTRIKTKDPGVVYAACNRCDKVLMAHSRNGTTHLKRHRESETCSYNNNPSSAADEKILRDLRATIDLYKQEKMEGKVDSPEHNTDLAKLDPWDPQFIPCYFTSSSSQETHHGHWKEIVKERAVIRIDQTLEVPRYVGLKRTFRFHHHNGTKMDWIMQEYHQADEYTPPDLLLEGSMVFRKVFQIYEVVKEVERMLNGDNDEEEFYNGRLEPMSILSPKYFIHCSEFSTQCINLTVDKLCTKTKYQD